MTNGGRSSRLWVGVVLATAAFAAQGADVLKVIIPTPPGGGTDGYFRVLVREAEPLLNETIIVSNVPGAGGTIGTMQLVRSAPDGQTVAGVWLGPITVAPNTSKVPYSPTDYVPIIQMSSAPYVMCVHPEFPANDGGALIAEIKRNPDKYTYGHDGAGGPGHLGTARILRAVQGAARDIPFKGAGDTLTAFLGKHIDVYVGSIPPIREHERSGKAKCLIVTSADRISALPNAWALRDLGIPDEETILWRALIAPRGVSAERVAKLESVFERAANSAAARKFLEDAGEQVMIKKGAALRRAIDAEFEAMGVVARSLKLAPN